MNKLIVLSVLFLVSCRNPNPTDEEIIEYVDKNNITQEEIDNFVEGDSEREVIYERIKSVGVEDNNGEAIIREDIKVTIKGRVSGSNREKSSTVGIGKVFSIDRVEEGGK